MSDLRSLEDWVKPLIEKLSPAERKKLARTIGQQLGKSQRSRIAAQQNPDGSAFAPRKPQNRKRKGAIRRGAMFAKIRQAKHLRVIANENGVSVGFTGRVAQIARIHQYGLRDHVNRGGPDYQYDKRELLGFTEADHALVRDLLIEHLT